MSIDPATLRVRMYPDPALRACASPVEPSDLVRQVATRMLELMDEHEGIGLAAPQVGLPWRMFVTRVPAGDGRSPAADPPTAQPSPVIYLNPVISAPTGNPEAKEEGCLSLPEIRGHVLRPPVVTISAQDLDGREFTQTGAGLLARCWQHEYDHLEGVLIIDRMLAIYRLKNRTAVRDLERDWADAHPRG
jgi:peptide deformylase